MTEEKKHKIHEQETHIQEIQELQEDLKKIGDQVGSPEGIDGKLLISASTDFILKFQNTIKTIFRDLEVV